ncbi:liprin-beta-1 isoform X5 [Strongylocentrotus purpuratus]|uniref:SAM domain-containing protein n=1 Tax=Strongylocentrotus purpuratus TaxID=7668 RepID=A0A7M7P1G3_STRPU|nr:liprin-beta-1 isoform X5 [Strongylocentrotus purpuratus]
MTNLASDASQMLAAALEQMDDIIAGSRIQGMDYDNGPVVTNNQVNITHPKENGSHADVPRLITELRSAAERSIENGEENLLHDRVEDSTRQYIVRLLGDKKQELATSPGSHEKMKRLEGDKDSLQLQVNVLTDQLEAQNEKIEELEYACAKKSKQLADSETKLLQESEIHCELEQSQQNYAIEASKLKARLDSVENETLVVRERAIMAESKIEEQQHEMNKLMSKYQQSQKIVGELQTECHKWQEKYMETQVKLVRSQTETAELKARLRYSHALLDDLQAKKVKTLDKEVEKEKLKIAVDSLIAGNKEKDKTIEDLNQRLSKFYHVQEMAAINGRVEIDMLLDIENQRTDSFSTSSSATGETDTSKDSHQVPQGSSPVSPDRDYTMMVDRTEEMFGSKTSRRSASLENLQTNVLPSTGDLAARSSPSGYRTLPSPRRNQEFDLPNKQQQSAHGGTPEPRKPRASFGKGLFKITSKKTSSAPNLAMTESEGEDALGVQRPRNVTFQSLERGGFPAPPGTPPMEYRKRKGIKKLIGKLKRSGSVNLHNGDEDEEAPVEFSRNGRFRATAGPRLAWSRDLKKNENGNGTSELNAPFAKWDSEQVADWLRGMGLAQYAAACRVWVKNGGTLLGAAPLELEKYLGLKNPLHRKKLQLALQAMGSECEDKQGDLDYHWVTRWLDDVGLPQYKDTFLEAKVDGRMLHYMTVDDLLLLKVTSAFHHVSIMRGIQCLRLHNFHPSCLRRRPTDEPYETGTQVALWTNHRVMEWLRSVDLSEYAPNLRGSGVHGGLMVLEPRFTAETLASILCIPGNKTLLRRHLSTHFISLIGPDIQQQKREAEKQPLFVPLNFLAKVKPKKRTFGKSRRGTEMEDYICPMDLGHPSNLNGLSHMNGNRPAPPSYKVEVRSAGKVHKQMDEDQADGPEMKEGTAQKFGALSQEIDSLTTMLSDSDMDRSTHV